MLTSVCVQSSTHMFSLCSSLSLVTCTQAWQCIVGSTSLYVEGGWSRDDYNAACSTSLRRAMRAAGTANLLATSTGANMLLPQTGAGNDAANAPTLSISFAQE
jgi:hypothetical protein